MSIGNVEHLGSDLITTRIPDGSLVTEGDLGAITADAPPLLSPEGAGGCWVEVGLIKSRVGDIFSESNAASTAALAEQNGSDGLWIITKTFLQEKQQRQLFVQSTKLSSLGQSWRSCCVFCKELNP